MFQDSLVCHLRGIPLVFWKRAAHPPFHNGQAPLVKSHPNNAKTYHAEYLFRFWADLTKGHGPQRSLEYIGSKSPNFLFDSPWTPPSAQPRPLDIGFGLAGLGLADAGHRLHLAGPGHGLASERTLRSDARVLGLGYWKPKNKNTKTLGEETCCKESQMETHQVIKY